MSEHPIIFNNLMVRAILEGRKTQTRRVCKNQPPKMFDLSRYGEAGDRLWVRETFALKSGKPFYRADEEHYDVRWRPAIFMPRWASRIMLEIVGVRIEMLQEICSADIVAEGFTVFHPRSIAVEAGWDKSAFGGLWDSINAKRGYSFASNPFVWVIEFSRIVS